MDDRNSIDIEASGDSEMTPEELYELTMTSKNSRRKPLVFDKHWHKRNAPPDKRYVVDSNAFERSLLKYLANEAEMSVKDMARLLVREAAMRRLVGGR